MPNDDKKKEGQITDEELEKALAGDLGDDGDDNDADDKDSAGNEGDLGGSDGDDDNSASLDGDSDSDNDGDNDSSDFDFEKELHLTKTNFGRKQKKLENQIAEVNQNVSNLLEAVNSLVQKQSGGRDNDFEDDLDPDAPIPLTMGELVDAVSKITGKQSEKVSKAQKTYENGYMKTVSNLGSQYPEKVHRHIVERMFKDFNIKHSDNPSLDAELNFSKAEAAILREVRTRKTNPLDKNKGKHNQNLGGGSGTDQDTKVGGEIKLDKYAADFIKSIGMDEEEAQKALTGDMPMYLGGKVSV